ncbi:unnamed protein product, partial [Gulo gulo]
ERVFVFVFVFVAPHFSSFSSTLLSAFKTELDVFIDNLGYLKNLFKLNKLVLRGYNHVSSISTSEAKNDTTS